MKVLQVYDKVNVSEKNGRAYHNCTLTCGVPHRYDDGTEVVREIKVRLTSGCVDDVLQRNQFRSMDELKGRNVRCFREAPIYLSEFEKNYNVVLCDVVVLDR